MSSAVNIPNTEGAAERRPNLPALTSIRFFLAAGVVLCHYRAHLAPALMPEATAASFGISAVTGFFVLSGFILTYQYWQEDRAVDKQKFLRARFARIVPLYWFSLLAALLLIPAVNLHGGANYGASLITSILLIQSWFVDDKISFGINPPGYTLSIEAFFYAVFPFIIGAISRRVWLWLPISILVCSILPFAFQLGYQPFWIYVCPPARLSDFIIGVAAGILFRRNQLGSFVSKAAIVAVLSLASTAIIGNIPGYESNQHLQNVVNEVTRLSYAALFAVLIPILAQQKGKFSAALSWAPLVVLGEASYATYLLHDPILRSIKAHDIEFLATPSIAGAVAVSLVIIAASLAAWKAIEKPWRRAILNWGHNKFPKTLQWQSVGLACAAALGFCLQSGNFDQAYVFLHERTSHPVAGATHVAFGDSARLESLYIWKVPQGVEVCSHWHALAKPDEAANLGVHVVDAEGKILHQFDHAFQRTPSGNWQDRFVIPKDQLVGAKSIALALFRDPNQTLLISNGRRDWGGHRLLTPLPDLSN